MSDQTRNLIQSGSTKVVRRSAVPALVLMPLLFLLQTPTQKEKSCWDTALTQTDLNGCAASERKSADAEMNRVYHALLKEWQNDKVVVEKLEVGQQAWLAYRDAHLDAYYPKIDKRFYGSVHPMCQAMIVARLTEERIRILKEMLASEEEGDVCAFYPSEPSTEKR